MKLKNNQRKEIICLYLTGKYSFRKLAKEFNVDKKTISTIIYKNNISLQPISYDTRRYTVNEHYFDVIDDEHKAYWLGFLYADGCNLEKYGTIQMGLQEEDREILDKFSLDLETNRPLYYSDIKKRNPNSKNEYRIVIRSKHMSEQLKKLGCVARKSLILEFPTEDQVPFSLIQHFLRGMWDGDGSSTYYKVKNNYQFQCDLASTNKFCDKLKNFLLEELLIDVKIYTKNNDNTSATRILHICKQKLIIKFLNWMYNNSTIYLKRKFESYKNMNKIYEEKMTSKESNVNFKNVDLEEV